MTSPLVGIIANPASGRDIRRLVAHGTVFDNNEKTAIVRRILIGLEAVGITRVAYMPENDFGIVRRAIDGLHHPGITSPLHLQAEPLTMPVLGTSADSTRAARLLAEMGAGCILTLGGDGTNRAVAKECATVPLVPISTGTNNVFPMFIEGTLAGMAAGLVALERTSPGALHRVPRLEVSLYGMPVESALIDVVVSSLPFIGSRAIWNFSTVREVILSRAAPATIGLSALGGALLDSQPEVPHGICGMHIVPGGEGPEIQVALAPGLVTWVAIREHRRLTADDIVLCQPGVGTIALDGEREIELASTSRVEVRLCADGPVVVDVAAALETAARAGYMQR
jgi:predicted polyphosphate/ATP-dependent NAD kinase